MFQEFIVHTVRWASIGLYIDSPKRIKRKKATINPKNNDDNIFQYAIKIVLKN